jgi:hypothetical protein
MEQEMKEEEIHRIRDANGKAYSEKWEKLFEETILEELNGNNDTK